MSIHAGRIESPGAFPYTAKALWFGSRPVSNPVNAGALRRATIGIKIHKKRRPAENRYSERRKQSSFLCPCRGLSLFAGDFYKIVP
jgi:hypothetical protein